MINTLLIIRIVLLGFLLKIIHAIKIILLPNIHLIKNLLYEILLKEVRKTLAGNPFTIGTIFGYLILKRRETRNIISLLYAKECGMKKEELCTGCLDEAYPTGIGIEIAKKMKADGNKDGIRAWEEKE